MTFVVNLYYYLDIFTVKVFPDVQMEPTVFQFVPFAFLSSPWAPLKKSLPLLFILL